MRRAVIAEALRDARACRGTVMLVASHDQEIWVAGCAAVEGTMEVRINEPPRAGLLRRRPAAATRRLEELGFVPGFDCWQAPLDRGPGAVEAGAALLDHALDDDVTLVPLLRQPGIVDSSRAPEPSAPAAEHVAAALGALARARAGKASFDTGRPARNAAWAFAVPEGLAIGGDQPEDDTTFPWSDLPGAVAAVTERLSGKPLWIALMDLPEGQSA